MELDSFTEKLVERTQARRDYLNQKLSEINKLSVRKRRTSDAGKDNTSESSVGNKQVDDSPKRQCIELSSSASEDDAIEDKENMQTENDQTNVFIPIHSTGASRGLAALKKSKTLCNKDDELRRSPKDEFKLGSEVPSSITLISKSQQSINSRLAIFAANIRNWENDDYSHSSSYTSSLAVKIAPCNKPTSASALYNPSSNSSDTVLHAEKSISNHLENGASKKHVTFNLPSGSINNSAGNWVDPQVVGVFSNAEKGACDPRKEPKLSAKPSEEEEQVRKVHVWDQAVLATLESQGFIKSCSKSKLTFDFPLKSKQPSCEKKSSGENSEGSRTGNLSSQNFVESKINDKANAPKGVASGNLELKQCPKQFSNDSEVCVSNFSSRDSNKDPAELPLSVRRALFEKAFVGGTQKQAENVCESNLSVAARAALFEKAAKHNNGPSSSKMKPKNSALPLKTNIQFPVSPLKTNAQFPASPLKANVQFPLSPAKNIDTNRESVNAVKNITKPELKFVQNDRKSEVHKPTGSLAEAQNLTSPLKNIGPHTLLLHERLSANSDWQNKEAVVKAVEERKNEISALRNHWEKVSTSSVGNSSGSSSTNISDHGNTASSSSLQGEKDLSVFTEDESSSLEEIPEEDDDQEDNQYSNPSEEEFDEEMPSEKNSDDECDEAGDITGEAVAVCDEMDELLSEALAPQIQTVAAPLPSPAKVQPKQITSYSSYGSSFSPQSSVEKFSSTPKFSRAAPDSAYESCSEVPLLHTVSFYRKQKQEAKTTPVRSIVRREQVRNPSSPESTNTVNIQEKIKALHNEVLTQQTVISQTSQALNLCRSTAEFSDSLEEVEGERLLLIATQKRQAYLNEIQRLKTLQCDRIEDGTGTLTINDIRLPLKREFIVSQVNGENDMVHYFLCLIRHQAQLVFTQMLSSKDGVRDGCLNFTNHINIKNLPADFSVAFEVYTLKRKKEVLPHEKKYHIRKDHSKIRLTPKGKKADSKLLTPVVSSPGGPSAVRTPNFSVVGFTRFTLKSCDRKSFTLEKIPFSSPLEGVLKFNIQLHAEHTISEKGFLTMFEDVSGFGAWHRRWCVLDGGDLAFWKYPDDEKRKEPIGIIDLSHCVTSEVRLVSRDVCARPHTFQLVKVRPHEKGDKNTLISRSVNTLTTTKHLLSADTKEERILWCQKLNDALTNVRKWNPHALRPVETKKDDK